jgi:ribonucleoside-diphosphate reductase alpha chain
VTTKYFRGAVGTDVREWSLKQLIDRVVLTYTKAGRDNGYFTAETDAEVFEHELTYMLLHQVFSFNSPVWFNVGTSAPQQVSACFILAVDDEMESILNWYKEEGFIFKGGSGAGLNLSRIRSSKELLSSGGTASGPVSFMRGADASPGRSSPAGRPGGRPRWSFSTSITRTSRSSSRPRHVRKRRSARCGTPGFDMDLGGKDITSVQYQNANNSVRVSDEFMRAVEHGEKFGLRARMTGEVIETVDAKELFGKMAQAAWASADPGIQYDDTINDWHTTPESGRITASNPVLGVHAPRQLELQPGLAQPAEVRPGRRRLRLGDLRQGGRAGHHRDGHLDLLRRLPDQAIGDTTRAFRQLGIGYANLGALLMASGLGYDSDGGRAIAASITSLMTGTAYRRSAELAGVVGPYDGYQRNAEAHRG